MEKETEQSEANGNESRSWYVLNAYANATFALRFVNSALEKNKGTPKEKICREVGEHVIEVMDAIEDENLDNNKYLALVAKGNKFITELVNALRAGTLKADRDITTSAKVVSAMGMRLSEGALDLESLSGGKWKATGDEKLTFESEKLPDEFIDVAFFDATARKDTDLYKKLITGDFEGITKTINNTRLSGQSDLINEAAHLTCSALDHFKVGLKTEKQKRRRELHERSFNVVKSMYKTMALDDSFYSSIRLFEDEKRLFLDGGKGSTKENLSWELYTTMKKSNEYVNVLGEVSALIKDIRDNELIKTSESDEKTPVNKYLLSNVELMHELGEKMFRSAVILIKDQFDPMASQYSKDDRDAVHGFEREISKRFAEVSSLYHACNTVFVEHKGKRVSKDEFEKVYDAVFRKFTTSDPYAFERGYSHITCQGGGA